MTRWGGSTRRARKRAIVSGIVAALVACALASLVTRGASGAPAPPSLSINDVSQTEGNSGNKSFVFTVTLSSPSDKTVKVDYQAVNGSATVGSDFNPSQGSLSFDPGQTTGTITGTTVGHPSVLATTADRNGSSIEAAYREASINLPKGSECRSKRNHPRRGPARQTSAPKRKRARTGARVPNDDRSF